MPPDSPPNAGVIFGTITRPHGVRGELRLQPARQGDELPKGTKELWLRPKQGPERKVTLRTLRTTNDAFLVTFDEIPDRNAAEAIAGSTVFVDAKLLPKAKAGEMYLYELIGAALRDTEGQALGTVRAIIDNHGQDLLVVNTPNGERLLPAVPAFLRQFDRANKTLTVFLPEGLWDEPGHDDQPPRDADNDDIEDDETP